MINSCVLMGRLVVSPELKTTQSGIEVCSFPVAVERSFIKSGEERQADFLDCVAWRQCAVFINKYFNKGDMIAITGEIQTRTYEDKEGKKRKVAEIVISKASFCGGKTNIERASEDKNTNDLPFLDDDEFPL